MKQDLKLIKSKSLADGAKYFSLFDGHIPTGLNGDKNVYLYRLDNVSCICHIIKKNPEAVYYICDEDHVIEAVKINMDEAKIRNAGDVYEEQEAYKDMKFDCIIMNPPYEKNLHLKILAEAITHLKDDESKVVNLSPVRWLQDPLAKHKKNSDYYRFEKSVSKHLNNIDVITSNAAQEFFAIGMQTDIAIYDCSKKDDHNIPDLVNPIVKRITLYCIKHYPIFDKMKYNGWRVRIPLIIGGKSNDGHGRVKSSQISKITLGKLYSFFDGYKDGKPWFDWYQRNQFTKTTKEITQSIAFNSEVEANNFIKQFNTIFIQYIQQDLLSDVHVAPEKMIWMGDTVNPRTGLKGYAGEWTNEDFYQFFNITDDEKKVIEDTMVKYEKRG